MQADSQAHPHTDRQTRSLSQTALPLSLTACCSAVRHVLTSQSTGNDCRIAKRNEAKRVVPSRTEASRLQPRRAQHEPHTTQWQRKRTMAAIVGHVRSKTDEAMAEAEAKNEGNSAAKRRVVAGCCFRCRCLRSLCVSGSSTRQQQQQQQQAATGWQRVVRNPFAGFFELVACGSLLTSVPGTGCGCGCRCRSRTRALRFKNCRERRQSRELTTTLTTATAATVNFSLLQLVAAIAINSSNNCQQQQQH